MVGETFRGKGSLLFLLVIVSFLIISSSSVFADSCNNDKIALLGDSITNYQGTKSWGNEFRKICGDSPVNFAHSGKKTDWMLQRLKGEVDDSSPYTSGKILGQGYKYLIVLGGTNDITAGWDTSETKSNLEQIYFTAKQNGMLVIAGTITPYNVANHPARNEKVKEINKWIKLQHQLGHIDGVIDFYSLLIGAEPCMGSEYGPASCNNVHPNTVGYKAMANKVVNEIFGGQTIIEQTASAQLSTSATVPDFKTMMILGSHNSGTRVNRVDEAYKLIQQGNFENIIVTGGCGAHDTAADNCEAQHMAQLLLQKGVSANRIILEEKAKSTSGNYKYSRELTLPQTTGIKVINPNDKLLVVSSSENVKAVAYCFRYKDQVDAYYVQVPNSYTPAVIPVNYDGGSYKSMVNGCRLSGQQLTQQQSQPQSQQQQYPPQQQYPQQSQQGQYQSTFIPKPVLGCKDGQRCQEVDQVWSERLSSLMGGNGQIWDHNINALADYKSTYFEERQVPASGYPASTGYPSATSTPNPGGITPSHGGQASVGIVSSERVNGIDISHHQGNINWVAVAGEGYKFAFIKATEGVGFKDNKYLSNLNLAQNNNILVGCYHYARPSEPIESDATAEANYFLNEASDCLTNNNLLPVLDLEEGSDLGNSKLSQWVNIWMDVVGSKIGKKPILYGGHYAKDYVDNTVKNKYPWWVAQYTSASSPTLKGWNHWVFWQYSDKGKVSGINTNSVDLNVFQGNENQLKQYLIGSSGIIAPTTTSTIPTSTVPFPPATGTFRFVVFSDFHNKYNKANALVNQIKSLNPAFVITNGDSINANAGAQQSWNKFFNQIVNPLAQAKIPVFAVVGNHDREGNSENLMTTVWKNYYAQNAATYNKMQNFNYQGFPEQTFSYNGKKFILAKVPTDSWANNGKISFIQNNVQPGSFIFGHSNIVNGLPFRNRASRAKDYQKRTELLQLLTTTNSMYINGHMHVFYPMIFREQGFQAKNIFVGSMADKNGITGSDGKYQPNSIAVFDVGSGVTINAFIYENGNFRQFSSADAQKYFPQNNQFTNHIQPLPLGGVIS